MTGTVAAPGTETGTGPGPILDPEEWLTVPAAAAAAHVLERTMRRWIRAGQVASRIDADGRRRVEKASLPAPVQDSASDRNSDRATGSATPENLRFVPATDGATDSAPGPARAPTPDRASDRLDSPPLKGHGLSPDAETVRRQAEEIAFLRAQLEARAEEVRRRDQAEAELRRLLLVSQQSLAAAIERPMLPPASYSSNNSSKPARVRWWVRLWGGR